MSDPLPPPNPEAPPARAPLLALEGVEVAAGAGHPAPWRDLALVLEPGASVSVRVEDAGAARAFADLCSGLLAPARGRVRFEGTDWRDRSADQQAAARGRIGRVFRSSAWVSNLDLDENILLQQRHHTRRPPQELENEARARAEALGLADVPRGRPSWTDAVTLQKAQWIRALLGRPALLLLDHPFQACAEEDARALQAAVGRCCERGAGVVWLLDAGDPTNGWLPDVPAFTLSPERLEPLTTKAAPP